MVDITTTVTIPQIAQKRGASIMFNIFKITAKSFTKNLVPNLKNHFKKVNDGIHQ